MDKVSQLQEQLNLMSSLYFQSIQLIYERAPILTEEEFAKLKESDLDKIENQPDSDPKQLKLDILKLKQDIVQCSRDFDKMVDELPGISLTSDEQVKEMISINDQNEQARSQLLIEYELAQRSLQGVSECLKTIANDKFKL
jgi:hypothetical protein